MPRVEREEFINVGVILFCPKPKFLQAIYTLDENRIFALCQKTDCSELKEHLYVFEQICNGTKEGGEIARLDLASRFRWLTATRSTIVQTSKVHPGLCIDPYQTLMRLHEQLVL